MLQVWLEVVGCGPGNGATSPLQGAQGAVHQPRHPAHANLVGQFYGGMDCRVCRDAVEFQKLVCTEAQQEQGLRFKLRQRLTRELRQGEIDATASPQHPVDQFGQQPLLPAVQRLVVLQKIVEQPVGVAALFNALQYFKSTGACVDADVSVSVGHLETISC